MELSAELQSKNQELSELQALKDHFLRMVAHDLRNPLSVILGFSELSAFTRAARRWYGEAPRSYRQKARASHR